jgi:hypothetical protein
MSREAKEPFNDPKVQWERLRSRIAPEDRAALAAACHLAERVHAGQERKTPEQTSSVPYIVHPLRVTRILAEEWGQTDRRTLAACLLHDALKDRRLGDRAAVEQEVERVAGKEVLDAVCALTRTPLPQPIPSDTKARRDANYFRVLFKAPAWVRIIKCADRVDNLRDALARGDRAFWERYSSETIGWHLYLARETAPCAEADLFRALVEGERSIRGRVPVWADGHLIDPRAAELIPEHIARACGVIGLALQGNTLLVGMREPANAEAVAAVTLTTRRKIKPMRITADALNDALAAGLYGRVEMS